jgi:hypothetical protein
MLIRVNDRQFPNLANKFAEYYHNLTVSVVVYSGYLVTNRCFLFKNRTFYMPRISGIQGWPRVTTPPTLYVGVYEHVIALCHDWAGNFYHVMVDIISLVFLCPPELISKAVIPMKQVPNFASELMNGTLNFLVIPAGGYVYGERVYIIDPMDVSIPLALVRLRNFAEKKYSIGRIPPTKYHLINRQAGARQLANMEELRLLLFGRMPQYPWEIGSFKKSIAEAAVTFDSIRVCVAAHGAGTTNVVFMQKGTLFVNIESVRMGFWTLNMTRALGVHIVFARLNEMNHFSKHPTAMPVVFMNQLVDATEKILKNMDIERK